MLLNGSINVDDKRRLRADHHYYAMADDVVAIDAGTVRLGKPVGELITPYE